MFENGVYANNTANKWYRTHTFSAEGCIEFWSVLDFSMSSSAGNYGWFGRSGGGQWYMYYSANVINWGLGDNSGAGPLGTYAPTVSAGTPVHIAAVWSTSKLITGSKGGALFINGAMVSSSANAPTTGASHTFAILSVNNGTFALNGNMDNIKIYDYAKTDFSDRFNERGGMNDQIIMMS
jgi:hypothetical protein